MRDIDTPPDDRASSDSAAARVVARLESKEFEEPFMDGLLAGLYERRRHSQILYARMRKLIGSEQTLAVLVFNGVAVDRRMVERAVELKRAVDELDEMDKVRASVRYLRDAVQADPSLRIELKPLLGEAAEENGNGKQHNGARVLED